MAKFTDKTMDEWDDIVEQWHNDTETKLSLREYMGLNEVEFLRYAQNIPDPSLDDDGVRAEAARLGRQAMVGLTIMEMLNL